MEECRSESHPGGGQCGYGEDDGESRSRRRSGGRHGERRTYRFHHDHGAGSPGGGCGIDGRGMAAAFLLGAEGIQMGTRFVASKESIVHDNYKNQIIKAKDIDSVVTGMSTGHPVRSLRNQMTREYLKLEKENADFMELEKLTLGSLRKAVQDGDTVNGTLMAGQIAGLIHSEQTCREIIEETVQQAQECIAAQGQHK